MSLPMLNKNLVLSDNEVIEIEHIVQFGITVPSWEEYCAMFENYDGQACSIGKSLTQMIGNNINAHRIIENLEYDGFHLSCDMVWDNELFYLDSRTKHLAYLCE